MPEPLEGISKEMENALTNLSFDDWVAHVFDHEVGGPQWYFDTDAEYWQGPPAVTVAYLTQLFEDLMPYVGSYSDQQLNQGFWYLVSNGEGQPWRSKIRSPSFVNLQSLPVMMKGAMISDVVAIIGSVDPVMGEADK